MEDTKGLGMGYWRDFMKRNVHKVKAKKGLKFDCKRADWCTYPNFELMYNETYSQGNGKGRNCRRVNEEEVWLVNKEGHIVATEEESFGMKTKYMLNIQGSYCLLMKLVAIHLKQRMVKLEGRSCLLWGQSQGRKHEVPKRMLISLC